MKIEFLIILIFILDKRFIYLILELNSIIEKILNFENKKNRL